jgi:L-iditol 2-dehydrogenase
MRQAVMVAPGRIEFRDIPVPEPRDSEVLIEVKRIGVCGSDIHVFHGKHPYTSYPVVQGHEFSGRVAAVGSQVRNVSPGQKVTATPQLVCGTCGPCSSGRYHICDSLRVMGFQAPGCAQDFFPVAAEKVVPLPDTFSYEAGALLEPLAVAVHAVERAGQPLAGKNVVVTGAGPIGNLVAQVVRAKGARRVVITDLIDYRLELAAACGLPCALDFARPDFASALSQACGGEPIDLFIECVGAGQTLDCAVQNVKKGGTIVVVGVYSARVPVDMGLVQDREIDIRGSLMYKIEDYLAAIDLIRAGKIETGSFITHTFPFEDYPKAYQFIDQAGGRNLKVMIAL